MNTQYKSGHRQQGIALVIFAASMVVIIGIAGFALDLSRLMLDDTRLQNAMDACALSGAQVMLDTSGEKTLAANAAVATFNNNLGTLDLDEAVTVEFSNTLENFGTDDDEPRYIRCSVDEYSISTTLARIFNIDTLGLNVAAVAGLVPITSCNPAPLMVCGDYEDDCKPCFPDDLTCDPEDRDSNRQCYGFDVYSKTDDYTSVEQECYLKSCAQGGTCGTLTTGTACGKQLGAPDGGGSQVADYSAGNFDLLDMDCEIDGKTKSGNPCIVEAFEEGGGVIVGGCPEDGSYVTTEPGNNTNVIKAFNTMFDPSDPNADSDPYSTLYSDYTGNNRRVLGVVIADCRDGKPGKDTEVLVMTVGCFFATRPAIQKGNNSEIWGQFIAQCSGIGEFDRTPDAFKTYKVVLYKDHGGPDS